MTIYSINADRLSRCRYIPGRHEGPLKAEAETDPQRSFAIRLYQLPILSGDISDMFEKDQLAIIETRIT